MIRNGVEVITVRFHGGPRHGLAWANLPDFSPQGWPPPDKITTTGGCYTKVAQSNLPDAVVAHPNVSRGVEYLWQATEITCSSA